jgi:hypothetical protein
VDKHDATTLACAYFNSGVSVLDIRQASEATCSRVSFLTASPFKVLPVWRVRMFSIDRTCAVRNLTSCIARTVRELV